MSDISVEITSTEITFNLSQPTIEIEFPASLPGVGVPDGGDVGDVLTKTGAGDYVTEWQPPGASANLKSYTAGQNLSSGRVVVVDGLEAWYFQNTDSTHHGRAFGITVTSATSGNSVTIQVAGLVSDAAFGFTADKPVWVGADGEIFDSQPVSGDVIQKAGVAYEDKKLLIDFSVSILKN